MSPAARLHYCNVFFFPHSFFSPGPIFFFSPTVRPFTEAQLLQNYLFTVATEDAETITADVALGFAPATATVNNIMNMQQSPLGFVSQRRPEAESDVEQWHN